MTSAFAAFPCCTRYAKHFHQSFIHCRRLSAPTLYQLFPEKNRLLPLSCVTQDSANLNSQSRSFQSSSRTNKYYTPGFLVSKTSPSSPSSSTIEDGKDNIVENDTIFALATGHASAAGVAIIRISGSNAGSTLLALTQKSKLPKARMATLQTLYDPNSKQVLDQALVIYFPRPKSYTSEDVVELHVHGSRAVISSVMKTLSTTLSLRVAGKGEFTRRAFENGVMDLISVESLSDLIESETDSQRIQALQGLMGEKSKIVQGWRQTLIESLARIEAVLDFVDDVGETPLQGVCETISSLHREMSHHLSLSNRTQIIRTGANIVLIGPPNAGKSSLLNALAQHDAAIVSPIAGTTRDVVKVRIDFNGIAASVSDTAGLRQNPSDVIEIEGINRTRLAASSAQIIICVYDAAAAGNELDESIRLTAEAIDKQQEARNAEEPFRPHVLHVFNKMDLIQQPPSSRPLSHNSGHGIPTEDMFQTCLIEQQQENGKRQGLSPLVLRIEDVLKQQLEVQNEQSQDMAPVVTRERHRHHVQSAINALSTFLDGQSPGQVELRMPMDLSAEDLRTACKEVGAITGEVDAEEILDIIFNEFCIGK